MSNKRGLFIVFEGIDGAGKKTLSGFTKDFLKTKKIGVTTFEYPDYGGIWGKIIDRYLHNEIELNVVEEFFLYFTDILKDQDKIEKSLKDGFFVISDRYLSSTVAFQCAKGFNYNRAKSIVDTMDVLIPDLTILLQIPPGMAAERKYKDKNALDRHEKDVNLLKNVDSMYHKISGENLLSEKWIEIDGSNDLKTVKSDIKKVIMELLETATAPD